VVFTKLTSWEGCVSWVLWSILGQRISLYSRRFSRLGNRA
jgi:hypothetical protein